MKKFNIVDETGNKLVSFKSERKAIGWMLFNTAWDGKSETGTTPDGRIVRFVVG